MDEKPDDFWFMYERAQELRRRLDKAGQLHNEEKRALKMRLRRETFELMTEFGLPHPLRALIAELWGGFGFVDRPNPAMHASAEIEGAAPPDPLNPKVSLLGLNKLRSLVNDALGDTKDYRRDMSRWREDPEYWRLVSMSRPESVRHAALGGGSNRA